MSEAHTYVLALDQGTTSSRAIVFDREGCIKGVQQKEFKQHYPKPGWVEHDALEIWESQLAVMQGALVEAGIESTQIAAIGITNQRETTLVWNRYTGEPYYNALVWQDTRNGAIVAENCIVGANALITENKSFPAGSLIIGAPARVARQLTDEEIASISEAADHYVANAARYRDSLTPID